MFEILQGVAIVITIYLIIDGFKNKEDEVLVFEKHNKRIIDIRNKHIIIPLIIMLILWIL